MTAGEVDVLRAELRALTAAIDLWRQTNCAAHAERLKSVEDDVVSIKIQMAKATKFGAAAAFFGSLLPGLGILFIVLKHFGGK